MLSSQDLSILLLAAMTKVGHHFFDLQGGCQVHFICCSVGISQLDAVYAMMRVTDIGFGCIVARPSHYSTSNAHLAAALTEDLSLQLHFDVLRLGTLKFAPGNCLCSRLSTKVPILMCGLAEPGGAPVGLLFVALSTDIPRTVLSIYSFHMINVIHVFLPMNNITSRIKFSDYILISLVDYSQLCSR